MDFTVAYDTLDEFEPWNEKFASQGLVYQNNKLVTLNFAPFLMDLKNRALQCLTGPEINDIAKLANSLGRNKSGGENGISHIQYYINAFIGESALVRKNSDNLKFFTDDHDSLTYGSHGTNDPDFIFTPKNNNTYTIEFKIYKSASSYEEYLAATNFHGADYVIAYLIEEHSWKISRKIDNYKYLCTQTVWSTTDPWLTELNMPKKLELINFYSSDYSSRSFRKLVDAQLPNIIDYTFV